MEGRMTNTDDSAAIEEARQRAIDLADDPQLRRLYYEHRLQDRRIPPPAADLLLAVEHGEYDVKEDWEYLSSELRDICERR